MKVPDDRLTISHRDKVILIVEDDTNFAKSLLDYTRTKGYKGAVYVCAVMKPCPHTAIHACGHPAGYPVAGKKTAGKSWKNSKTILQPGISRCI